VVTPTACPQVVTFTADLGQGEELEPARQKAEAAGVKDIFIDDLREEFVRDFVFPMFRWVAGWAGRCVLVCCRDECLPCRGV
jgi:argininosuccinate synthase